MKINLEKQLLKRCGLPSVLLVYLRSGCLIYGYKVEAVHRLILSYFRRLYKDETGEEYDDDPEEEESVVSTAEVKLSFKDKLDSILQKSKSRPDSAIGSSGKLKS